MTAYQNCKVSNVQQVIVHSGDVGYPLNDPERGGEFLFCAEPIAKSGANYCSRHTEIAVRVSGSPSSFSLSADIEREAKATAS
jgi:hypothetical protein